MIVFRLEPPRVISPSLMTARRSQIHMKSVCEGARASVLAVAIVCALASGSPTRAQTSYTSSFAPDTGAVFAVEHAPDLVWRCSRPSPGPVEGYWAPSDADIDQLEPLLSALLDRELGFTGDEPDATHYYRQYGGLIIAGRRVIYVNGFGGQFIHSMQRLMTPWVDWRVVATHMCGGGQIAFGVEYDPSTRKFTNFAFNTPLK